MFLFVNKFVNTWSVAKTWKYQFKISEQQSHLEKIHWGWGQANYILHYVTKMHLLTVESYVVCTWFCLHECMYGVCVSGVCVCVCVCLGGRDESRSHSTRVLWGLGAERTFGYRRIWECHTLAEQGTDTAYTETHTHAHSLSHAHTHILTCFSHAQIIRSFLTSRKLKQALTCIL